MATKSEMIPVTERPVFAAAVQRISTWQERLSQANREVTLAEEAFGPRGSITSEARLDRMLSGGRSEDPSEESAVKLHRLALARRDVEVLERARSQLWEELERARDKARAQAIREREADLLAAQSAFRAAIVAASDACEAEDAMRRELVALGYGLSEPTFTSTMGLDRVELQEAAQDFRSESRRGTSAAQRAR